MGGEREKEVGGGGGEALVLAVVQERVLNLG